MSNHYQITGKITRLGETRTFESGSSVRTFWLEEESEPNREGKTFPNTLEFEVFTRSGSKFDNAADLDRFPVGSLVSFGFAPRGRVYKETRCFVSLRVVSKIELVGKSPESPSASPTAPAPATPATPSANDAADDEMPF